MDPLAPFSPETRAWFTQAFAEPTPAQRLGWPAIASGAHTLIQAPTGSGKTLAAFLYAIDRLTAAPGAQPQIRHTGGSGRDHAPTRPEPPGAGLRVLYVSPLKALNYDAERNLR